MTTLGIERRVNSRLLLQEIHLNLSWQIKPMAGFTILSFGLGHKRPSQGRVTGQQFHCILYADSLSFSFELLREFRLQQFAPFIFIPP